MKVRRYFMRPSPYKVLLAAAAAAGFMAGLWQNANVLWNTWDEDWGG